ncbi:hypothetical protein R5W23_006441 [Gemmata sp. JC673]|uniref:Uncharacterized protein n=1 Tax=Gemmata algarum TaxID=2975278 RepID=A0ABU5EW88_9BACT|nr:hypothetical protein [Gemmata algarum]MDY3559223.1 hypothetical protein [Gemmata algarum]
MATDEVPRPSPANVAMTLLLWAVLTVIGVAVIVFGYGAICASAIYNDRAQRHGSTERAYPEPANEPQTAAQP